MAGPDGHGMEPSVDDVAHSHDYILDDVRQRLLKHVRARVMGDRNYRVDVAPTFMPRPNGGEMLCALMASCPSPLLGERLLSTMIVSTIESKDVALEELAGQLVDNLIQEKARINALPIRP